MLLITVGTEQYQFNALMHWIELLIKYQLINENVLVQYGFSTHLPDGSTGACHFCKKREKGGKIE
jgi:UDP-N-acetylglucosamine transferase subunit ALG13